MNGSLPSCAEQKDFGNGWVDRHADQGLRTMNKPCIKSGRPLTPLVTTFRSWPDPSGQPPDPERIERILGKLRLLWRRMPDWGLVWLIVNLASDSRASDTELELELDRLLELALG
jgi:hypothetical protein